MIETLMLEAINLAKKSFRKTLPNPRVGAIVFDDSGRVLGRGYHKEFGAPHAEIKAIKDAEKNGFALHGANLCVTLEPCNHTGKTPPCTEAILRSGIKRVFIGTRDDCKTVSGCGFDKLELHGIEVKSGILEAECRALNPGFHKFNETSLPYVHLKAAISLNGKMTNRKNKNAWFTGEESRKMVHQFRAFSDLIITGVGTIKADNPRFSSRLNDTVIPDRIAILDPNLELLDNYKKKGLNIFREGNDVIIITKKGKKTSELKNPDLNVIEAETDNNDLFVLPSLIKELGITHNFREIFIEAGPSLVSSFLKLDKRYLDRITLFIAPVWFNNDEDPLFTDTEKLFPDIKITEVEMLGNTLCVEGRL
ncbi:MAG: bifunctional diaminohydroxyphosphoribosylaminopyrimidine deaminase/5-amino-6-(5-phosphoribosylamino)uracil reductase RibD [Proteobacteria bacterium]|nr:bifunctional diaminohydroxyphosphoribosylaminopyrimidine deaminase/5-amino-6-(5-phosphoribosylamino)uracil reductase RibD [Pseudomonadota bacterium]